VILANHLGMSFWQLTLHVVDKPLCYVILTTHFGNMCLAQVIWDYNIGKDQFLMASWQAVLVYYLSKSFGMSF
jgi:hypothetical protein